MKITLLGTGGSAGLPQIGGPDGRGDWGQTDPDRAAQPPHALQHCHPYR